MDYRRSVGLPVDTARLPGGHGDHDHPVPGCRPSVWAIRALVLIASGIGVAEPGGTVVQ